MSARVVLNSQLSTDSQPTQSVESAGMSLQRSMLSIKGSYLAADGRGVDYDKVRGSPEFGEYSVIASGLAGVDLSSCGEDERKAFFINVYNALTIHGLVNCKTLPSSVLELEGFWKNTCYNIGGHVFSLDDIEHGVLRCNRPHPGSGQAMFPEGDPRLNFVATSLDPRIHFALVCGAKSCPAIQVYSTAKLERGLTSAAKSFCQQEVHIDSKNSKVTMSKIFMWYFKDFASSNTSLLEWILQYLDDSLKCELESLLKSGSEVSIEYSDYNWFLNKL